MCFKRSYICMLTCMCLCAHVLQQANIVINACKCWLHFKKMSHKLLTLRLRPCYTMYSNCELFPAECQGPLAITTNRAAQSASDTTDIVLGLDSLGLPTAGTPVSLCAYASLLCMMLQLAQKGTVLMQAGMLCKLKSIAQPTASAET